MVFLWLANTKKIDQNSLLQFGENIAKLQKISDRNYAYMKLTFN